MTEEAPSWPYSPPDTGPTEDAAANAAGQQAPANPSASASSNLLELLLQQQAREQQSLLRNQQEVLRKVLQQLESDLAERGRGMDHREQQVAQREQAAQQRASELEQARQLMELYYATLVSVMGELPRRLREAAAAAAAALPVPPVTSSNPQQLGGWGSGAQQEALASSAVPHAGTGVLQGQQPAAAARLPPAYAAPQQQQDGLGPPPPQPAARKYYVVAQGYRPGLYDSWEEVEQQTLGYVGAEYQAFSSLWDAQKWQEKQRKAAEKRRQNIAHQGGRGRGRGGGDARWMPREHEQQQQQHTWNRRAPTHGLPVQRPEASASARQQVNPDQPYSRHADQQAASTSAFNSREAPGNAARPPPPKRPRLFQQPAVQAQRYYDSNEAGLTQTVQLLRQEFMNGAAAAPSDAPTNGSSLEAAAAAAADAQ